jgi:glycosyltransferase involved in cell wall biosynthesis
MLTARRSEPAARVHDEPAVVDIAIVIPAFDETATVGPTVDRTRAAMAATSWTHDIIVVDDGSTDRTAEEAARHGARVIRLPDNRGYGAALKAGIQASRSEYVLIVDADGTYPPEMMPALIAAMTDVDMVVGARAHDDRSIPRRRRLAKAFLRILASYLTRRRIPDLNSGLRLMRRSVLMQFFHILPSGFSFTTTITLALLCNDYPVAYLPVTCGPRVGASKLKAKEFTNFVMLVLRTVVLFNPLRVFLPAGAVIFAVGTLKLVYDLVNWNLSDTAVMAFLAALIVWSVGLLADMIARVQLHQRDT